VSSSSLKSRTARRAIKAFLALFAPLVTLVLAEVALRLVGFGHPTNYLIPGPQPGQWIENQNFGARFFPPGLLRVPPPTVVRTPKPADTTRILLFGESAAMGDPRPAYGVARYLEVLLRDRFPGGSFEVVPLAMTAINSYALVEMARQATRLNADYWIVFAGNNEILGPYGAGSTLGGGALPRPLVRAVLAAKATRLGQAILLLANRWTDQPTGSTHWTGLKILAGDRLAADHPHRARVYAAFDRNLRDMVRLGQSCGARVLLSTVAVNLADCGPFGWAADPTLDASSAALVSRLLDDARRGFGEGTPGLDRTALQAAVEADPSNAVLRFLQGQAALIDNRLDAARQSLAQARDQDTIPLRADSRLEAIVRNVAAQEGATLVDAATDLATAAPRGIPGAEFFYEHVHLTPEGNHALARSFANALLPALPEPMRSRARPDWASPETCATRLALTAWNRAAAAEFMLRRCWDAPFSNRVDHAASVERLATEVARQRKAQTPQAARFVTAIYTNAIALAPDDPHLRRGYAEFLQATGDIPEAIAQWRRVIEWTPHHPFAYLQAGILLRRTNDLPAATQLIDQAIVLQPDWVDAHLERGEILLARGRPGEATRAIEIAIGLQPDHARAHLRLAEAQATDRRRDLAIQSLQRAVALDPRLVDARYLLGVEYAVGGQLRPAEEQFAEVVRLDPHHARGRYNLGIAYAQQARWGEAIPQLSEAVRLDPRSDSAKQALAQAIVEQRKTVAPLPAEPPGPSP
jgi:tetratricopeptide (TPR) repeat protein